MKEKTAAATTQPETLVAQLRRRASETGLTEAFRFLPAGDESDALSWSFKELDNRAQAAAALIRSREQSDRPVLLCIPPGLDFIGALFGCFYAGVPAVPVAPPGLARLARTLPRIRRITADADAGLALSTSKIIKTLHSRPEREEFFPDISWAAVDTVVQSPGENRDAPSPRGDAVALIQYTSGSTGDPKGVAVTHANLSANLEDMRRLLRLTREDKNVCWLPPYHDMGLVGGVLLPVYAAGPTALIPPLTFLRRPLCLLETVCRQKARCFGAPNFALDMCVRRIPKDRLSGLRLDDVDFIYTGAEPVRPDTLERFQEHFAACGLRRNTLWPCYGLAENTLIVSGPDLGDVPETIALKKKPLEKGKVRPAREETKDVQRLASCGRPGPGCRVAIVDPRSKRRRPPDEIGEIWVSGASVGKGYWKRPEETRRTFAARIAGDEASGPWLRTGDLGFFLEGKLYIAGRAKDVLVINGRNHFPQDIEYTAACAHPALIQNEGAAFSLDTGDGEELVVVQACAKSKGLDYEEVVRAVRSAVSEEHGLNAAEVVLIRANTLPKTTSGKVQRRLCRRRRLEGGLRTLYESDARSGDGSRRAWGEAAGPRDAHGWEDLLRKGLARRLGRDAIEIGRRDPFGAFGLDSAAAVVLAGELEESAGVPLPATLLYDHPDIASLAAFLAGETSAAPVGRRPAAVPVAVVGMSCRFPGAPDPEAFAALLREGRDAVGETPEDRRFGPAVRGGFLDDLFAFDPALFGLSPREAEEMDPQQRLLLEVAWEALERGGMAPDRLAGSRTGVFIGISAGDHGRLRAMAKAPLTPYAGTGNAQSIAANRLSYVLGLTGPSLAVDSACSSSLAAVHLACRSLGDGESDMALAGGVNVILASSGAEIFSKADMLAADGRCKTFSDDADGYVRSEGCAVVVLKRLEDALAADDPILGVVPGTAVNQDGRSNGLTAPSRSAQAAVVREALDRAGLAPDDIDYLEAHGSGTALGDPIEVAALADVFGGKRRDAPLVLASVKTNIGHTEAAAGIAGLCKTLLALGEESIPPHLHLRRLNKYIDLDAVPAVIPIAPRPWPRGDGSRPRRAGVSSFGFGGLNAHIVVEEAPPRPGRSPEFQSPPAVLTLSAGSEEQLRELAGRCADHIRGRDPAALPDICHTSNTGRAALSFRFALPCGGGLDPVPSLHAFAKGDGEARRAGGETGQIAFVFPGKDAPPPDTARRLCETSPTFREHWDACAAACAAEGLPALVDVNGAWAEQAEPPARFAFAYALAGMWESWGIRPAAGMGWDEGEYAAACLAGVFSLQDALRLLAARDRREASPDDAGGEGVACTIAYAAPQWDIVAPERGDIVPKDEITSPAYWEARTRRTPRRRDGLDALHRRGVRMSLEIGTNAAVSFLDPARRRSPESIRPRAPRNGDVWETILAGLAFLWTHGASVDWEAFDRPYGRRKTALPTYPFSRTRYCILSPAGREEAAGRSPDASSRDETAAPTACGAAPAPATQIAPLLDEPDPETRQRRLLDIVSAQAAEVLRLAPGASLDPDISLISLGLDSLMFTALRDRLQTACGAAPPASAFVANPSIRTLARLLDEIRIAPPRDDAAPDREERLVPDAARRNEPFPLTDVQHAYWIGRDQGLLLGGVGCFSYVELDIPDCDPDRLSTAVNLLVQRHDMLRAVILENGSQRILPEVAPLHIDVEDFSDLSPERRREALSAKRENLSHQTLPVDRAPLFDIRASRLDDRRTRLHIGLDLLIADAWSAVILARELAALHNDPQALPPAPELSFRDYVLAERRLRQKPAYAEDLAYWRERADDLPPGPELPLARTPKSAERPRFTRRTGRLNPKAWERLKRRAAEADLTPSALLLAAFAEVLAFWSKTPRFTITLTLFQRRALHEDVNAIVGDFTSLLLVETERRADQSFSDFAGKLQGRLWRDMEHQSVSGVEVVRRLAETRKGTLLGFAPVVFTSGLPLSRTGDAFRPPEAFPFQPVYAVSQTPQTWLDHQVFEFDGRLVFSWDANEALFPDGLLDDMFAAYKRLLRLLAADNAVWPAAAPDLLPKRQRELRRRCNATQQTFPDRSLHRLFFDQAGRRPDRPAIITPERRISHGELKASAERLALLLRRRGAKPGERIAVVMDKGWEQAVAVLGVCLAGAAYLPIDPALPRERMALLFSDSGAALALTQSWRAGRLPEGVEGLAVDALIRDDALPGDALDDRFDRTDPGDPAYVIYTSGSTGRPKGVVVSHRAAVNTILDINRRFNVTEADRVLCVSNLNFDLSVYDIFGLLAAGGCVVMGREDDTRDPAGRLALMRRAGVTLWNSVPALMQMLLDHLEERPEEAPRLRLALLSGDWIPPSTPARLKALQHDVTVAALGGATEAGVWSNFYVTNGPEPGWDTVPYGRPLANQRYCILDAFMRDRPDWVPGRLYIAGTGLAEGYLNDPKKTAAAFVRRPETDERLYNTGDFGRLRPDGRIEFLGREDARVKINGHRIELGDVEAAMRRCDGVGEAAAVVVNHDGAPRLAGFVVPAGSKAAPAPSPEAVEAMRAAGVQLTDPLERLRFKEGLPGLRRDLDDGAATPKPPWEAPEKDGPALFSRRMSIRRFSDEPIEPDRLEAWLDELSLLDAPQWPVPRRRYGSAGGTYAVQAYLLAKPGRVRGLEAGAWHYHPVKRVLLRTADAAPSESLFPPGNAEIHDRAAFALFLVADMGAIRPLYGNRSRDFALIEAGLMTQLLETAAFEHDLGLCQIGAVRADLLPQLFRLGPEHEYLHCLVGGGLRREAGWTFLDGLRDSMPDQAGTEAGDRLSVEAVRARLGELLPGYMIPTTIAAPASLPLTRNGKVDRRALARMAADKRPEDRAPHTPPADADEQRIHDILREILGRERIGVLDNFFELGANSLHLVSCRRRLADSLNRDIPITEFFEHPTIRALAESLRDNDGEDAALLAAERRVRARRTQASRRRTPRAPAPSRARSPEQDGSVEKKRRPEDADLEDVSPDARTRTTT